MFVINDILQEFSRVLLPLDVQKCTLMRFVMLIIKANKHHKVSPSPSPHNASDSVKRGDIDIDIQKLQLIVCNMKYPRAHAQLCAFLDSYTLSLQLFQNCVFIGSKFLFETYPGKDGIQWMTVQLCVYTFKYPEAHVINYCKSTKKFLYRVNICKAL